MKSIFTSISFLFLILLCSIVLASPTLQIDIDALPTISVDNARQLTQISQLIAVTSTNGDMTEVGLLPALSLEWSPTSDTLHVTHDGLNLIQRYDIALLESPIGYGMPTEIIRGPHDHMTALSLGPDGRTIITGGEDDAVRIIDTGTGKNSRIFNKGSSSFDILYALAFSSDGKTIAASGCATKASLGNNCEAESISLWDVDSKEARGLFYLRGFTRRVGDITFSRDGQMLAAITDQTISLWDMGSYAKSELVGHTDVVTAIDFSPDGLSLASASLDGTIRIWNIANGSNVVIAKDIAFGNLDVMRSVKGIDFSPDGTMLVTVDFEGNSRGEATSTLKLWKIDGVGELISLSQPSTSVVRWDAPCEAAFSPTGLLIATAGPDGVFLWGITK